jgi:hypothetical protein
MASHPSSNHKRCQHLCHDGSDWLDGRNRSSTLARHIATETYREPYIEVSILKAIELEQQKVSLNQCVWLVSIIEPRVDDLTVTA